jgi:hypothetical protein
MNLQRDLHDALRSLRKSWGFTALATAVVASALPALRAARLDPLVAIRNE